MDPLHDWAYMVAAIMGLTLGTVATRSSFFVLPARIRLPERVERALRYAPACALAAIIAPGVLSSDQQVTIGWGNHQMWALVAAALVFAKTRNMLAMMVVGMGVFTALRLLA
ncbi:MAG: AzlD domain-containing protein [Ilumatobacteraceae bacterium]